MNDGLMGLERDEGVINHRLLIKFLGELSPLNHESVANKWMSTAKLAIF